MLKRTRQILAAFFFTGITLLLLDVSGQLHHYFSWMPKVQLIPALLSLNFAIVTVLLILTLIMGRIYCSVICPLGVFQDLIARLGVWSKKNRYTYSKAINWLRYGVLAVFIVLLLAGFTSIAALISPYSTYGRMVTHLFQPIWTGIANLLAAGAEKIDSYMFSHADFVFYGWIPILVTLLTFAIISVLAYRNGRTWCNTICPVGTLLGFISKYSLVKININESKCVKCGMCAKNCKASCIDYKNFNVDTSRCVVCGNCISHCKKDALSYNSRPLKTFLNEKREAKPTDHGRRSFMAATGMLATTALAQEAKKVDGGFAVIEDKAVPKRETPITPPGSLSAKNLKQHCTSCQLCISECPNKVLRPSTRLETFMQPEMGYENGYCRPECTRCSDVCPTGAIKTIKAPQKSSIQIGHAVWIKDNCLPLTDGVSCGNCARHCPTGAISMVNYMGDSDNPLIPVVNTEVCIGCGACENLCPARPFSAIYVEGHEVHREI